MVNLHAQRMEEAASAGADGSCLHWLFVDLVEQVEVPERIHVLSKVVSKKGFDVLWSSGSKAGDPARDLVFDVEG